MRRATDGRRERLREKGVRQWFWGEKQEGSVGGGEEPAWLAEAAQCHFFSDFQTHVTFWVSDATWLEAKKTRILFNELNFYRTNVHRCSYEYAHIVSLPPLTLLSLHFFPKRQINSLTIENDNPSGWDLLHIPTQEKHRLWAHKPWLATETRVPVPCAGTPAVSICRLAESRS